MSVEGKEVVWDRAEYFLHICTLLMMQEACFGMSFTFGAWGCGGGDGCFGLLSSFLTSFSGLVSAALVSFCFSAADDALVSVLFTEDASAFFGADTCVSVFETESLGDVSCIIFFCFSKSALIRSSHFWLLTCPPIVRRFTAFAKIHKTTNSNRCKDRIVVNHFWVNYFQLSMVEFLE